MLDYSILESEGVLVIKCDAPLSKEDFNGLGAAVNSYLSAHAKLKGILIISEKSPGWENSAGFAAHMHFIHEHHRKIERVALVTDSLLAGIAEVCGKHSASTEVRHFSFVDNAKALDWLTSP